MPQKLTVKLNISECSSFITGNSHNKEPIVINWFYFDMVSRVQ